MNNHWRRPRDEIKDEFITLRQATLEIWRAAPWWFWVAAVICIAAGAAINSFVK